MKTAARIDRNAKGRNHRWTELSALNYHSLSSAQWAEVKEHVEYLYRRIKALESSNEQSLSEREEQK